jgi:rhodanese-related sulfurtransferase
MTHLKLSSFALPLALLLWTGATAPLPAVTVSDLQHELAKRDNLTVIDVRLPAYYARGHIPGAINIPASLCAIKQLPPLGQVVVCGDGFGRDDIAAAAALAAKPGIKPDLLIGGFAAWEGAHAQTTRHKGVQAETPHYISCLDLKALKPGEAVLVDMRQSPDGSQVSRKPAFAQAVQSKEALTDLAVEFPGFDISHSPFDKPPKTAKIAAGVPPLLVLIDTGDGTARDMARTLEANGIKRYAILAGGELALDRHGQPGRQRSSSSGTPMIPSTLPNTR